MYAPPGRLTQMAALIDHSPVVQAQRKMAQVMNSAAAGAQETAPSHTLQARGDGFQALRDGSMEAARLEGSEASTTPPGPAQLEAAPVSAPNRTGLPDNLKAGVETLSGFSLDDVRVHYNSAKPAQLNALAYAQGTQIHVAPGQEQHLPHEAWHIVQQKQGRVQPTMQLKQGIPVNDDAGLEREADIMGAKATSTTAQRRSDEVGFSGSAVGEGVMQLKTYTSKADPTFTVTTSSNALGTFAQARQTGQEYEESSIQYNLMRYRNATGEGELVRTNVPMATQTDTMHAYPERQGVGTLLAATAIEHMETNRIQYFQPDIAKSSGGNAMAAMISGTKRSAGYMEDLISRTDGRQVAEEESCSCLDAIKSFFCCGSSKKPEKEPLLEGSGVKTYAAIEVDIGGTKGNLKGKVDAKFTVAD
jgi:Domain of unknown function (DUF4157)